jgi:hypothetical protein
VSDPQHPDEANLSKRERQKLRRQQKMQQEQAAAKAARAKRGVATVVVAALVLGGIGLWGANWWGDRQERARQIEFASENLEALGCTPVEEQPIIPSQHLSGQELASSPPDALYPDRPTTSGRHLGGVAASGFFDKVVDERLLVHNLEHGYINIFFAEDASDDEVADIEEFVNEQIAARTEKIIATRWKADMPGDARFALTAWGARQTCEQWDRGVALAFIDSYHYLAGTAPEKNVQPHRVGMSGVADPNETEGDVLFPPLGSPEDGDGDIEDVMEQPEGSEETPDAEDGAEDAADDAPEEDEAES